MNDLERLNKFLEQTARAKVGVRRKIVLMEKFIEKMKENIEPQYSMED